VHLGALAPHQKRHSQELAAHYLVGYPVGLVRDKLKEDLRVLIPELRGKRRHDVCSGSGACAERDEAPYLSFEPSDIGLEVLELLDYFDRLGVELVGLLCGDYLSADPVKKGNAQLVFEVFDVLADRWRGRQMRKPEGCVCPNDCLSPKRDAYDIALKGRARGFKVNRKVNYE
jgi:hypothetical protein